MARGGATAIPAATIETWIGQAHSERMQAGRAGRVVLRLVVKRQRAGQTMWQDVNRDDVKFAEAVQAAALQLPGDTCNLTDTDGATYRVMAF